MSVVANVAVNVDARNAINQLRQVQTQAQRTEQQFAGLNRATNALEGAFAGIAASAAAINGLNIARSFINAANAADAAQRKVKLVSSGFDDYRSVLEVARSSAERFGLSQTEAANAVADVYTRLRPVGFQLNEINAIYEGFNTAVKLSGVSAEAASSAFLQLSQGLGSGTLQGDELRSVLEQMPAITQAIAKELNISAGQIKKFGSEGKITADVIVRALDRIRTEGADKLAQSLDTPQQRIQNLRNAFEQLQIEVGSTVAPIVIAAMGRIAEAVEQTTEFVRNLKAGFEGLAMPLSGVAGAISNINAGLEGTIGRFSQIGQSTGARMLLSILTLGGSDIIGRVAEIGARRRGANAQYPAPAGPEMPIRLSMQGRVFGGGKTGKGGSKGGAGSSPRESQVPQLQRELELAQKVRDIRSRILAAELAEDKERVIRLQLEEKLTQLQGKQREIMATKDPLQEKNLRVQLLQVEADEARAKAAYDFIKLQQEQLRQSLDQLGLTKQLVDESNKIGKAAFGGGSGAGAFRTDLDLLGKQDEALKKVLEKYPQIGQAAQSAAQLVTAGTSEMIAGTKSIEQVFGEFLKSIGDMLIQSASQMIATYIALGIAKMFAFGANGSTPDYSSVFGGKGLSVGGTAGFGMPKLFAEGGVVTRPTPAIVGEGGEPEYIIPASKMRGAMERYAAGARGSNVIPGNTEATGGSGAVAGGGAAIDVRYTIERINSVDYVTADQFRTGMRQAAKEGAARGEQQALRRLQMSASTRKRIGV